MSLLSKTAATCYHKLSPLLSPHMNHRGSYRGLHESPLISLSAAQKLAQNTTSKKRGTRRGQLSWRWDPVPFRVPHASDPFTAEESLGAGGQYRRSVNHKFLDEPRAPMNVSDEREVSEPTRFSIDRSKQGCRKKPGIAAGLYRDIQLPFCILLRWTSQGERS